MTDTIPDGWAVQLLGKLATIITKGTTPTTAGFPYETSGVPFVKVENIDDQGLNLESINQFISITANDALKRSQLTENDVLFSIAGTIGKTALVESIHIPANTNQAVAIIRGVTNFFTPKFLRYQLKAASIQIAKDNARGGGMNNVSLGDLKKTKVKLPPLAEQKVIAEKLDSLLAQVEATKTRLEGIPDILKQFRQSVLAAAVSGELTEDWREKNDISIKNWSNKTFDDICHQITVGFVGKMKDQYQDSGIPFLRSQNVRAFEFSTKNLLYISEEFHQTIYKSRLEPGDLAIVRSGAPGTTCVIPDQLKQANCSDLVIARPSDNLNADFGCIFMNSESAQKNVADNQVGVAQQHFNVGSMKKMPIDLPSIEEQAEIVRRVEELFALADKVEAKAKTALENVKHLTQSILAQAFSGELTKDWRQQNPDLISGENSAEALLERIKAEREKLKPVKKTRKKKT